MNTTEKNLALTGLIILIVMVIYWGYKKADIPSTPFSLIIGFIIIGFAIWGVSASSSLNDDTEDVSPVFVFSLITLIVVILICLKIIFDLFNKTQLKPRSKKLRKADYYRNPNWINL